MPDPNPLPATPGGATRFHFARCLGAGGFGEVHLARMTTAVYAGTLTLIRTEGQRSDTSVSRYSDVLMTDGDKWLPRENQRCR